MDFDKDDKVDIIDLLINLLRDHEKKLDEISFRLEKLVESNQPLESIEQIESQSVKLSPNIASLGIIAQVSNWNDFRDRGNRAQLVSVNITETHFKTSAYNDGVLYNYIERLPSIQVKKTDEGASIMDLVNMSDAQIALSGKLKCGLTLETKTFESKIEGSTIQVINYTISVFAAKEWVASQLDVDESSIVEGELNISHS